MNNVCKLYEHIIIVKSIYFNTSVNILSKTNI